MVSSNKRGLIVLDPKGGKSDNPFPAKPGCYESVQNFIFAEYLKYYLERLGFFVILTKNSLDDDPPLEERGHIAGKRRAILFLSVCMSASEEKGAELFSDKGVATFHSVSDVENNIKLEKLIHDTAVSVMNTKDLGVHTAESSDIPATDCLEILKSAAELGCKRSIVIRLGSYKDADDAEFLQSSRNLKKLAKAEAEVIQQYFSENII